MVRRGKKYQEAVKLIDQEKAYPAQEAIELASKTSYVKFDETLELHLRMGLDPRHADQQIRGVVLLPFGLGKTIRILVFAQGEAVRIAEEAGADHVGGEELVKKIEEGFLDFDIAIATPDMMSKIGKLGKILGRRGLMPNPKLGTVVAVSELPRVVKDARKGRAEFKLDKSGNVHLPLGKVSFEPHKLMDNLSAVMETIVKAKPSGAKGLYIKSATLTTSMGPGISLELKSIMNVS